MTYHYIYSIPHCDLATSVDVERVFSRGRLVLSYIRNRLSVQTTRALLCLSEWIKAGIITAADFEKAVWGTKEVPMGEVDDEVLDDDWADIR